MKQQNIQKLKIHCYAECKGGAWQAFSVEFGLAAQGDSFRDVRKKLDSMVGAYLFDALVGEDLVHQKELLARKAPLYQQVKYYYYWARMKLAVRIRRPAVKMTFARAFVESAGKFNLATCAT